MSFAEALQLSPVAVSGVVFLTLSAQAWRKHKLNRNRKVEPYLGETIRGREDSPDGI